jgi:hypothetical protein
VLPRVTIVCGPRLVDASDARRGEDIVAAAARAIDEHAGTAVAVVRR